MQPTNAYEFRTLTWNMQGAGSEDGSKWTQLEQELIRSANSNRLIDVVSLQESGGIPNNDRFSVVRRRVNIPSDVIGNVQINVQELDQVPLWGHTLPGDRTPYLTRHALSTDRNPSTGTGLQNVTEYRWYMGTSRHREMYYVYHYALNSRNNNQNLRTNLAIVSRFRADEVIVFMPNAQLNRPVLGIRIGFSYFFTIHAPAYNSNPSANIVIDIENYISGLEHNNYSWIIMGDFNRAPSTQPLPAQTAITRQIVSQNQPTHIRGGLYDYAVVGATEYFNRLLMAAVLVSTLLSDHYAIRFDPKQ